MAGLSFDELRELHGRVEHEIARAVLQEQPTDGHARLLAAIDARLQRLSEGDDRPTFARRQRIAAER